MVEGCGGFSLSLEALEPFLIGRELFGKDLQGNPSLEVEIFCKVDLSHAALTQLGGDPEVRQRLADQAADILLLAIPVVRGWKRVDPLVSRCARFLVITG